MAFLTSDNVYNCVILTRHYCAYNNMAFVARNTRMTQVILRIVIAALVTRTLRRVISRMVACFLPSDICALSQVLFMARYSRYNAGGFYPLL